METNSKLKPIAFANGDGGTARGANIVMDTIFTKFPHIDVPLSVERRLQTKDTCLDEAIAAFVSCGSGFKNSTASKDPRITQAGLGSLNILMRPKLGTFGMLRLVKGPGKYKNPCGVWRFGDGRIYNEQKCFEKNGSLVTIQRIDLAKLQEFTQLAPQLARELGLHLVVSGKGPISESERYLLNKYQTNWSEQGLVRLDDTAPAGDWKTENWNYILTDDAGAELPIENGNGKGRFHKGGFLLVTDCENGDTFSDIIDGQHGNFTMGSRVYCKKDGAIFSYEELTRGTADKMKEGPLVGDNFLSPMAIISAISDAYRKVNPSQGLFFDAVDHYCNVYLGDTDVQKRDTEEMCCFVAEKSEGCLV